MLPDQLALLQSEGLACSRQSSDYLAHWGILLGPMSLEEAFSSSPSAPNNASDSFRSFWPDVGCHQSPLSDQPSRSQERDHLWVAFSQDIVALLNPSLVQFPWKRPALGRSPRVFCSAGAISHKNEPQFPSIQVGSFLTLWSIPTRLDPSRPAPSDEGKAMRYET